MASIRQLALALVMLVVLLAAGIGGFYVIGPVLQQLGGSGPGAPASQVEQTQIPARVSPGTTPSPTRFLTRMPSALPERTATAAPETPLPPLATATPEALPSPSATQMPTSAPATTEVQATDTGEPAEVVTGATATGMAPAMGPQILAAPGELTVSEPDGTGIFTITLNIEPLAAVTIPLSVSNEECLVAAAAVRLDSDNWRRGVGVQVAAVDDEVDDGPQTCAVTLAPAISQAADYGGAMASGVTVTVEDEDIAQIAVVPTELSMSEPDGSGVFTVTLGSEPLAVVTIPLSVSNEECLVTPSEVRLDTSNWRRGVQIQVAAVDDDVDDGPQTCEVTLATAISQALDYGGGIASGVTVTVEDEDTAGIAVTPRELTMSEPDGTGVFTVTLDSEPLAEVTIPLRVSSQECLVTPSEVRLDRDNWRRGVEVQVAAVDDAVDDGPQTCAVTLPPARSQAAEYVGKSAGEVVVTVEDEDTAGIAVAPRELALSEPDGSGSFTITLSSEPLVPVTIPLSVSNEECLVATAEVRLDGGNWQRGAEVQVMAADDERNDGPQTCTVALAPALSQAAEYAGQSAGEVLVTVEDEDMAGIAVVPRELAMSEPDGSGTFTITLNSEPLAAVTIPLSVSGQECLVETAEVSLNSENWRRGVGVRVAAVDDNVDDGPQTCAVTLSPAVSQADDYGGRSVGEVMVTVADEDAAGIAITPGELALSEPGETGTFTVTLGSQPTATVVISLTTDAQVTVDPSQLTFTDANWQAAQSVVVTAVDDLVAEGQQNSPIRPVVRSEDQNYAGLAMGEITARITDNDTAGVVVRSPQIQLTEGGTPQSYAVLLASQPTEPVTVTITTDGQTTVSPTLLVFTELQWNVPQTVTVKAAEDGVTEGPHSSTIRHSGSSKDQTYLDTPIDQVVASVADKVTAAEPNRPAGTEQVAAPNQPGEEATEGIRLPIRITPTLILVAFLAVCVILATMFELLFSGRRR